MRKLIYRLWAETPVFALGNDVPAIFIGIIMGMAFFNTLVVIFRSGMRP